MSPGQGFRSRPSAATVSQTVPVTPAMYCRGLMPKSVVMAPSATMTHEQDRVDLARHEDEIARHASFNYALFDTDETALLGCVYIDPPEKEGADAEISWWVVDECVGTDLEEALDELIPRWIAESWPFARPRFVGRDLSWPEWLALPGV